MTECLAALGPQGFRSYDVHWSSTGPVFEPTLASSDTFLVPGLVDLHFHGAYGVDFMQSSHEEFLSLCKRLSRSGYEAFLPTTVTASLCDVEAALAALPEHPLIAGFHLEGPFISALHPGAQPSDAIIAGVVEPEWDTVLLDPRLKIVTLAPERQDGLALVEKLTAAGTITSLGHSDATFAQATAAFDAGMRHTTHTFNATRRFHHREAGAIGAALTDDRVSCELIYDGHHVSKPAADVLFRCKGDDRVIAVSDSSAATGLPDGTTLSMWGHECLVREGQVTLASNGALAGSAVTLLECFRNLWRDFGPERAIGSCCLNPRRALGMSDLVQRWLLFDRNLELIEVREI